MEYQKIKSGHINQLFLAKNRLSKNKLTQIICDDPEQPSNLENHVIEEFWELFNGETNNYDIIKALRYLDQRWQPKLIEWINSLEE
jgi:hypothetical protein